MNYEKNYYDYANYILSLHREKNNDIKYEKHHIIPKSLGGLNTKDNLILLTPREHFLAHYLLTKFTTKKEYRYKMLKALWVLSYIKKEKIFIISSKQFAKLRKEVIDNKCIPVICLETMKIFPSMKIASSTVGGRVDSFFKGRIKSAGGYSNWEFYDPTKVYTKKESVYNYAARPSLKKKVVCLDTQEIFESIKEAAIWAKVSTARISGCCRNIPDCKSAGGYHWKYQEN